MEINSTQTNKKAIHLKLIPYPFITRHQHANRPSTPPVTA